jgi:hypothetical protein
MRPYRLYSHRMRLPMSYSNSPIVLIVLLCSPSAYANTHSSTCLLFHSDSRTLSCMDLTASISQALIANHWLTSEHDQHIVQQRSSTLPETIKPLFTHENIYEELQNDDRQISLVNTRSSISTRMSNRHQRSIDSLSSMKKGISEPNLAKDNRYLSSTASPLFSTRNLINRFKRLLPRTLSKQSLMNDNVRTRINDSDDSTSTASDTIDDIHRTRINHVNRAKHIYDTLSTSHYSSSAMNTCNRLRKQ